MRKLRLSGSGGMTIPSELLPDLQALERRWRQSNLEPWLNQLPQQLSQGMAEERYGDLPRWRRALSALPILNSDSIQLDAPRVGCSGSISAEQSGALNEALQGLHPWRKGPYQLFDTHINTEWRSDWKWERLLPGLAPLKGRKVLDVGCGSGYHCWRMLGAGAQEVIGIDPTPLFVLQFKALQHYLQQPNIHVLPVPMEHIPRPLKAFDTVFSMGVLYHRRSPMDHLLELKDALRPGGQLVLETLVVSGDEHTALVPTGRYARMGNVWFLPSTASLCKWLTKLGFKNCRVIDTNITSTEEQRSTDWMRFHSLAQFLQPDDPSRTVEGYPAPCRAIVTADA